MRDDCNRDDGDDDDGDDDDGDNDDDDDSNADICGDIFRHTICPSSSILIGGGGRIEHSLNDSMIRNSQRQFRRHAHICRQ